MRRLITDVALGALAVALAGVLGVLSSHLH